MTFGCAVRTVAAAFWIGLMVFASSWLVTHGYWWATIPAAVSAIVGARVICAHRASGSCRRPTRDSCDSPFSFIRTEKMEGDDHTRKLLIRWKWAEDLILC